MRTKCLPTYHPAAVLRQWDWRPIAIHDLRRAAEYRDRTKAYPRPAWNFIIRPTMEQAVRCLSALHARLDDTSQPPLRISFDLETRAGHIACAGISWSLTEAICIPLMERGKPEGYWSSEEEAQLVHAMYGVLTHKRAEVVGQNILYDAQYTYRHWHFIPNIKQDCMISQHSLFSALPKSLAFQASMYCQYYVFWKEEGKQI